MVAWVKAHELSLGLLVPLILGLLFVAASAYTVSPGLGLLVTGAVCIGGGHWITYLRTVARR